MTANPNALTLVHAGASLAKRVTVIDGTVCNTADPPWPRIVRFETVEVRSPDDLLDVLSSAAAQEPAPCVVRADPLADMGRRAIYDDREKGPAGMRIMPRSWAGYDLDKVPAVGIDPMRQPEWAVVWARRCLPSEHHTTTVVWQLTASAGKRRDELRLRLWYLFDKPLLGRQVQAWCRSAIESKWLDPVTLRNEVIPHFVAVAIVGNSPDPCPRRWGLIRGAHDRVPVPDSALVLPTRSCSDVIDLGGDIDALVERYGDDLEARRKAAVAQIRKEIKAVRDAADGARHPTYLHAASRIQALCDFWCIPLDKPRALLEAAYLETLNADEIRKRERGSIKGVWDWLEGRTG